MECLYFLNLHCSTAYRKQARERESSSGPAFCRPWADGEVLGLGLLPFPGSSMLRLVGGLVREGVHLSLPSRSWYCSFFRFGHCKKDSFVCKDEVSLKCLGGN